MSQKFTTDAQILCRADDHFVVCDLIIYPLTYHERMDLQRQRIKLLKEHEDEDVSNFEFSKWMIDLVHQRIHQVDVKLYELTDELRAMSDDEVSDIDDISSLGDLTMVDRITDLDSLAYYSFTGELYPLISVVFGQGLRIKKKLIKSSPAPV